MPSTVIVPAADASAPPGAASPAAPEAGNPAPAAQASVGATAGSSPARPRARSGGYYLDDGPGAEAPPDPTRIADAVPRDEPLLPLANRPYEALGEAYFPDTSPIPYSERGLASWYGRRFHGHRTSSGEPYDMYAMTAAHKTLPIPSYVRVTSVASGKSVIVRINDRGPFHAGRVIDLSYTAAQKLDITRQGSGEVLVERVFPSGGAIGNPTPADLDRMAARPVAPRAAAGSTPPVQLAAVAPSGSAASADAAQAMVLAGDPGSGSPSNMNGEGGSDENMPGSGRRLAAATATATPSSVRPPDDDKSGTAAKGRFLQLGAFREAGNAERLLARARVALPDRAGDLQLKRGEGLHRVWLGPFTSADEEREAGLLVARKLHVKPRVIAP